MLIHQAALARWWPDDPKDQCARATGKTGLKAPLKPEAFARWVQNTYPEGIPAGTGAKALQRDFTAATGIPISDRTIRRARAGK